MAALKNFLSNERDKSSSKKRGSNVTHFSLDWQSADIQFQIADTAQLSPDAAYDREWAVALLEQVIVHLKEESIAEGRGERFEHLKSCLTLGKGEIFYAPIAAALAMDEGAVRVAVHRLRKRYLELLRNEVAQTLSAPAMVEEEFAALLNSFYNRIHMVALKPALVFANRWQCLKSFPPQNSMKNHKFRHFPKLFTVGI